jgi:hypothetical protein
MKWDCREKRVDWFVRLARRERKTEIGEKREKD